MSDDHPMEKRLTLVERDIRDHVRDCKTRWWGAFGALAVILITLVLAERL